MSLSDPEIIIKFKIKPKDKVLDIGGAMKQHDILKIDTLVDVIKPEESPYTPSKLTAKNFIRLDICRDKLPFKDKEFDFCLCTHTLEDLTYPFLAIEEMSRVAKRGYIATPSFGFDIVFSPVNFTDWLTGARRVPGIGHHKWLFHNHNGQMRVIPKNYPLLYTTEFQITRWLGEEEFRYYWEGEIKYEEFKDFDFHKLIGEYRSYLRKNEENIQKGLVQIYLDNPIYYLKEIIKLFLKKGEGFKHLKN